jgi:dynein heavy chain
MIICMQPVGEAFRRRLRNFPSLVNCTTIDWFQSWPGEALTSTASSFFNEHFWEKTSEEERGALV